MRTIVITGAASGLGKALAFLYADKGYQVVVADRNETDGKAVVSELLTLTQAHFVRCDVSVASDLDHLADAVRASCGACHILINNAGIASSGNLMDTDDAEWERLLNINVMSCINSSKAFIPLMKESVSEHEPGAIVNIASLAAIGLLGGMMSYNVSKAAVVAFSESLRCELLNDHIHVMSGCPSFFKTNLTTSMISSSQDTIDRVERWMANSHLTAESVASDIAQGIDNKELLVFSDKPIIRIYRIYQFIYNLFMRKKKRKVK